MASSNSPCAACKCGRQKCTQDCVFASPPDQSQKFMNVHQVFGGSNVGKRLSQLSAAQGEDAVNSQAYEAEYRLRDPVYRLVGQICILQNKLEQVQHDLHNAKQELASYIGPSSMLHLSQHPNTNNNPSASGMMPYNMLQQMPMLWGLPTVAVAPHAASFTIPEPQQQQPQQFQQVYEAALQFAVAQEQQEMFRTYYQQQQQQQLQEPMIFNGSGFDAAGE